MPEHPLRKTWLFVYGFPLILLAMTLAVLGADKRFLQQDQICLISILAVACVLYLRKPWACVVVLAFSLYAMELDPPLSGAIPKVLRSMALMRIRPLRAEAVGDLVDEFARPQDQQRIDREVRLYYFFVVNCSAFLSVAAIVKLIQVRPARKSGDDLQNSLRASDSSVYESK